MVGRELVEREEWTGVIASGTNAAGIIAMIIKTHGATALATKKEFDRGRGVSAVPDHKRGVAKARGGGRAGRDDCL